MIFISEKLEFEWFFPPSLALFLSFPFKIVYGGKGGAWQAQLVQQVTLDLGVFSSSPILGVEPTLNK